MWNLWLCNIFIIKKRVAFVILKTKIFILFLQSSYDLIEERRVFNLCIFWDLDLTLCDQIPH